jgi:hypothetical protein
MAQDLFITKKRIGRPPGKTKPQTKPVQVPIESIAALDAWIAAQPEPRPSRPEAIRRLLDEALAKSADPGSIAAEDLNASNDE